MAFRKSAAIAALGMFALILGGAAADEPKSGGELVVGFFSDITGLDPTRNGGAAGDLTAVLFERLLVLRDDGSVVPALATEREWLDDTTMRFTLREGVTFHSGTAFDANAAKWNIDRLIDPDLGAIQFAFLSPVIKETRVVDDHTLDIELQGPNASWEKLVASHTVMLDPAKVEELGDGFSAAPSGTGAFMLEEWAPRQYVKMTRNPDWWDEGNYVETLRFDIIPELSTRVLALQAGDIDVLTNPTPDSLAQFESGGFQVASISSDRILKLDFDHQDPKWQNEALRRAVLLATDSEGITEALIAPFGSPAQSVMTSVHESYVAEPGYLAHDPEAAMAALEEAGYARGSDGSWSMDGEALTIHIGVPPKRDLRNDDIAEALAADLQAIGIDVQLTVADWGIDVGLAERNRDSVRHVLHGLGFPARRGRFFLRPLLRSEHVSRRADHVPTVRRSDRQPDRHGACDRGRQRAHRDAAGVAGGVLCPEHCAAHLRQDPCLDPRTDRSGLQPVPDRGISAAICRDLAGRVAAHGKHPGRGQAIRSGPAANRPVRDS